MSFVPDTLPPLDEPRLGRLDAYADRFADVFTRADQLRWFRLYLRGLLGAGERKNVEAIAARVGEAGGGTTNFAQALQHFVSNSPWDASRVLARYRDLLPPAARANPGAWVVHDGIVEKKGRHSVGTQRQFARSLGRKLNCQIAVVVGRATLAGYVPLAVRLYLPGYWLRENPTAVEKTVPVEFRGHASKSDIAAALLDGLTREGWRAAGVAADDGYLVGEKLRETLVTANAQPATGDAARRPESTRAAAGFEWLKRALGLDHFEGRTWIGWHHHVALVLTAYGFLAAESVEHH